MYQNNEWMLLLLLLFFLSIFWGENEVNRKNEKKKNLKLDIATIFFKLLTTESNVSLGRREVKHIRVKRESDVFNVF